MLFRHSVQTALRAITINKMRATLTMLGIVIGIAAIILVMSLGQGAQDLILGQIQGQVGSKVIEVAPGRQPKGPTDFLSIFSDSLKQDDVDALMQKGNVPHAKVVMPMVFGSVSTAYGSETHQATLYGMTDAASHMYNLTPGEGRFLTEDDVKGYSDVVVIGAKVKEELFGNDSALDQKIRIKGRNFRVIGVLASKGQGSLISFDDTVLIPYTTAQRYVLGIKYFNHIIVEADSDANVAQTVRDMTLTIRNSHNITDPAKDDFNVSSQADALKTVSMITDTLTLFLMAVAAISLLVGGIGIMNIMLVSVTERTREIGLRKAIGATNKDILIQFLLEAVALTLLGGMVGILLGALFSFGIALLLSYLLGVVWAYAFPVSAAVLGFGTAALIGLVFGIYPARHAAHLNPIDALRYE